MNAEGKKILTADKSPPPKTLSPMQSADMEENAIT